MTTAALRRIAPTHQLVPIGLFGVLVAVVAVTSLALPANVRGPATIVASAAVVLLCYLRVPKPTLLAFALFVLFYDTLARWLGPSVRNVDEAVIPCLVLLSLWRTRPWQRGLIEPLRDGGMAVVVALAVVASLVNAVPVNVWLIGLLLMLKGILFLYVVIWHDWDDRDVRQAAVTVLGVGTVVLALGFAETMNGPAFRALFNLPGSTNVRGQLPGVESIFAFPVLFAWFTAFVAMFLFSHYVVLRRWWMLGAALLFSAGMFLTGRRRAIVGLAVALVGGLVAQFRRGVSRRALVRLWLPVGVVALVLAIVFLPGLKGLYDQTVREWLYAPAPPAPQEPGPTGIQYVNGNPRLLLYETSVKIAAAEFPLGAGLGRFGSPMSRVEFSPLYQQYGLDRIWGLTPQFPAYVTDTFWPHILGEIGVFGVLAYVIFLGALGRSVWRSTRVVAAPYLHAFCLGAWMVFLHALVESLASSMYESPPRIYLAFGAIGMALALSRAASKIVTTVTPLPESAPAGSCWD